MTSYDKEAYESAFPGIPIWKPGDLVKIVDGPDAVNDKLGRVVSNHRAPRTYCHFDVVVKVGHLTYYCLPDALGEPGVLEKLADEA